MTSDTTTSANDADRPVIDMAELGARLTARRAALGDITLPRNAGRQRTDSKRALLAAIEAAGGNW